MFNINPNLRTHILENIHGDWPLVTKAAYIYQQLCETLQYSTEYLLDEDRVRNWYTNPDNLEYIDGVKNNNVVCFTFNAIFAQLLIDSDVCQEDMIVLKELLTDDGKSFAPLHATLSFTTNDSHSFNVDSTQDLFRKCELALAKFNICAFSGWTSKSDDPNQKEKDIDSLGKAREQILSSTDPLKALTYQYLGIKGEDYKQMPLQERFDFYMTYLHNTPEYSLESFTYLLMLKDALFTKEELGKQSYKCNFEVSFLKDATTKELRALILFNPEGYGKDKGFENFDFLQIYEFSVRDRTITSGIDREDIAERLETMQYVQPKGSRAKLEMIIPREAHISPVPPGGETLIWDRKQNPVNVDHYERLEVLTGNRYVCDLEGNRISQNQTLTI